MSDDRFHPREGITDPFDDFLAQLLADISELLPTPTPTSTPPLAALPPASTSPSASGPESASDHVPNPLLICQWVSTHNLPFICGANLSPDPKIACAHFRRAHNVHGNEKVIVSCHWRNCQAAPMQRGSLVRHVLSVHLGLLRWRCEACGKVLSRKGAGHACTDA